MPASYTNVQDVPLALAVFLASDYYDHDERPNTISVTTLMKPLRQIILPSRIPPTHALPSLPDMMENRTGAAIHDGIERAWLTNHVRAMQALGYPQRVIDMVVLNPPDDADLTNKLPVYLERRSEKSIGKWTITGKFDIVVQGMVEDFKNTKVWTYQNQVNNNKYALQGSLYRWLNPKIITNPQMRIHFIFRDWQQSKSFIDKNYPSRNFKSQTFDMLSLSESETYVRNKLALIDQYWDADEKDIPHCNDEDLWRRDAKWKFYLSGDTTTRASKVCDSAQEAILYQASKNGRGVIKEVPGEVVACKYCPGFMACSQKDLLIEAGDLNLYST